jgi:glutathione S-transferase
LKPNYIHLNSKGVVPTLVHDGKVICDSAMIIRYLDEQFPHPSLVYSKSQNFKIQSWQGSQARRKFYLLFDSIKGAIEP